MKKVLFCVGHHKLASGDLSDWKIECDALSFSDWEGLARMAVELLPNFGEVIGVPRGGLALAKAMRPWATDGKRLVVDDVFTTGGTIRKFMQRGDIGLVAFARKMPPSNIIPIFIYGATP